MPTPPSLSHPAMRRPLREGAGSTSKPKDKAAHPLASSFVAPSRAVLEEGMQGAAGDEVAEQAEDGQPEQDEQPAQHDAPHEDQDVDGDDQVAQHAPDGENAAEDSGDAPSDLPNSANGTGEIAPLPVPGDASALNLFLDAADYLNWDMPIDSDRQAASGSRGGEGGSHGHEHEHASLTDSMGAMLEAQRLLANRMAGEEGEEETSGAQGEAEGNGNGEKSGWQEHVALLMGLGQSGGANAEAAAGDHAEHEAEQEYEQDGAAESSSRGARGGRREPHATGEGDRSAGPDGANASATPVAGPSHRPGGKEVFSEEQRKANHIRSEHRRRNAIKIGYQELGCLEHISVNIPWPSGEELVDESGNLRDDPGVHIEGRLMPTLSIVKSKRKRGDGDADSTVEEPVYKKQAPNKVAKGWSKNAVLQKGAALSRWLREGNTWLAAEVERLEKLLAEAPEGQHLEGGQQNGEYHHGEQGGPEEPAQHGQETDDPDFDIDPNLAMPGMAGGDMSAA